MTALLRIGRPEHLKEQDPAALGRLLRLDRAPEVKTVARRSGCERATNRMEIGVAARMIMPRLMVAGKHYVDA